MLLQKNALIWLIATLELFGICVVAAIVWPKQPNGGQRAPQEQTIGKAQPQQVKFKNTSRILPSLAKPDKPNRPALANKAKPERIANLPSPSHTKPSEQLKQEATAILGVSQDTGATNTAQEPKTIEQVGDSSLPQSNALAVSGSSHLDVSDFPSDDWIKEPGVRLDLSPEDPPGTFGFHTPYIFRFPDGTIRMYYGVFPTGHMKSAVSTDGLVWIKEPGVRLFGAGHAHVMRLTNGLYRMYLETFETGVGSVGSAISTDGLNWTREPGLRITNGVDPIIIELADGRLRMYFRLPAIHDIRSAVSLDGLTWNIEPGIRISDDALEFAVIRLPDSTVVIYYAANDFTQIKSARTQDGLNFTVDPGARLLPGPPGSLDGGGLVTTSIVQFPDGTIRMYYQGSSTRDITNPARVFSAVAVKKARTLPGVYIVDNNGSPVTLETPFHNPPINFGPTGGGYLGGFGPTGGGYLSGAITPSDSFLAGPNKMKPRYTMQPPASEPGYSSCNCFGECDEPIGATSGETMGNIDYQAGDPIFLNNREFIYGVVASHIVGVSGSYRFELYYRSRINFNGPVGRNWDYNYNKRLVPHPSDATQFIYYDGKGRGDAYQKLSNGTFLSPEPHFTMLKQLADGSFVLRKGGKERGTKYFFLPLDTTPKAGKLSAIEFSCGHRMTLEHDNQGRLSVVLDTLSRPIFHEHDSNGRLVLIRDFAGRETVLSYNNLDQLIEIRSPIVVNTPTGNDFPNGKTWRFAYSSGLSDERLNHNLTHVFAPNEVAVSLINYYDEDDRMTRQDWGGTNTSGVVAGGSVFYTHQVISQGVDPNDLNVARAITTVTDRNENVTLFYFNKNGNMIRKEEKTRGMRPSDPPAFTTEHRYSAIGLLKESKLPQGNRIVYVHDDTNPVKFHQGNLLSVTHFPDPGRGSDQDFLQVTYSYDPVYNRVMRVTEQRGNDPMFVPQNGGTNSPKRYTTEYFFDWMEGGLDASDCLCGRRLRDEVEDWNLDTTAILPLLNQGDLNGDGKVGQMCGNTVLVRYPKVKLRPDSRQVAVEGGDTQTVELRMGFTRSSQIDFLETPEGEKHIFLYYQEADPDGDGEDVRSGLNNRGRPFDLNEGGYLKEVISDFAHTERYRGTFEPAQIRETYGYDKVGNIRFYINGRRVRTDYVVNALNQVVEIHRAADISQAIAAEPGLIAFGYKMRLFYDHNNNVVRTEVQYTDGNNADLPQFIPTSYFYDILDNVLSITQTVSTSETVTTEFRYDKNENLAEIRSPMAVSGLQPGNIRRLIYDERDLIFKIVGAPGTPEETVATIAYDLNGNKTEYISGRGNLTTYRFDGFDRLRGTLDAVGNEVRVKLDPASNVILSEVFGPIGGPSRTSNSTAGNVLLARSHALYDELGRMFQRDAELFVPSGVITTRPPLLTEGDLTEGDGKISSTVDFDRNSRVTFVTQASPSHALEISQVFYDGLGRVRRFLDAHENELLTDYDPNSNPVRVTFIDQSPTARVPGERFVTINVFDSLDRLFRTTDSLGQTRRMYRDSRDLVTMTTDAQGPMILDPLRLFDGFINDDGNVTHIVQDGLGRTLTTIRELRVGGLGGNTIDLSNLANADGLIRESTLWDKNSRVVQVLDDKGNPTGYSHDNLNRPVRTLFADGTEALRSYDRDHNLIGFQDNNSNLIAQSFDAINRLTNRLITRSVAHNVKGTTLQSFEHDGLSRITLAFDNNNPDDPTDDSTVKRAYDSLSRVLEELQNGKAVSTNWREDDDLAELIYPNGRKISYLRDKLDRIKAILSSTETQPIAQYDYIGNRLLERAYGNGTRLTMLNDEGNADVGYDGLPRLVQLRHLKGVNELIAGFRYGYNRENIKLHHENLVQPNLSELHKYDSAYRSTGFARGPLTPAKDAIAGTPSQSQTWQLDGVSNWASTVVDGVTKTQTVSNMNEYSSFAGTPQAQDENGNLKDDGKRLFFYDFANRLAEVWLKGQAGQANTLLARYAYDAFNRRFSKSFKRKGEYETDANTIALYHFNETDGPVIDSSGNNNHGEAQKHVIRGVDGLFGTNAVEFCNGKIKVRKSESLNNIADKLTVETWVFLKTHDCKEHEDEDDHDDHGKANKHEHKHDHEFKGGSLVHRPGSYRLEVLRKDRQVRFTLFTQHPKEHKTHEDEGEEEDEDSDSDEDEREDRDDEQEHDRRTVKVRVVSNAKLLFNTWVHLAAVYDGQQVTLFVDGVAQSDVKPASGLVKRVRSKLLLGGKNFRGKLEETRISNTVRTEFSTRKVLRSFFYSGWQILEEREQPVGDDGSLGTEVVTRQFTDGAGIDEHLTQDVYDSAGTSIAQTLFYHENHRGDTVALTDFVGNVLLRLDYSAYGEVFAVNQQGALEPFVDADFVSYTFQGRQFDEETGLYYYRHRYYDPKQGRFLQRDPTGYLDSMNLHEFAGSSPFGFIDPLGLQYSPDFATDTLCFAQELEMRRRSIQQLPRLIQRAPVNLMLNAITFAQSVATSVSHIIANNWKEFLLGLTPIGTVLDVRDLALASWEFGKDPGRRTAGGVALALVAFAPGGDIAKGSSKKLYRELNEADRIAFEAKVRLMPKGTGGDILVQVQGRVPTKYMSASETIEGAKKYGSGHGLATIDVEIAIQTGSTIVPHQNVLQHVKRHGTGRDIENVRKAQEVLIKGGIDPSAIIRIQDYYR